MHAIRTLPFLLALGLSACGGAPRAPEPYRIAVEIAAAPKLNAVKQTPMALVARVYKLRQRAVFDQAPFDSFLTEQSAQAQLGADLIEAKEIMLVPGQTVRFTDQVSRDAGFIGVVALFHSPAPQRWRLAFASADAEKTGISIGAHGCSLSIGAAAPAPCQPTPRQLSEASLRALRPWTGGERIGVRP